MITIQPHLITGIAFGCEYVSPEDMDSDEHCVVLDLGILRLLFWWE
jgi:hypothetical protein